MRATQLCYISTWLDQCTDYHISYYVMFTYYYYTCMSCLHMTVTPACHVYISLLHMHVMFPCDLCLYSVSILLSYGSPCRLPVLLFHVIRYMLYAWYPLLILLIPLLDTCSRYWYGYSRYWTWELLTCYMWTSTSIDPVILIPLYCSRYIVPDSRCIVLCYQQSSGPVIMLPVSCTVFLIVTLCT